MHSGAVFRIVALQQECPGFGHYPSSTHDASRISEVETVVEWMVHLACIYMYCGNLCILGRGGPLSVVITRSTEGSRARASLPPLQIFWLSLDQPDVYEFKRWQNELWQGKLLFIYFVLKHQHNISVIVLHFAVPSQHYQLSTSGYPSQNFLKVPLAIIWQ